MTKHTDCTILPSATAGTTLRPQRGPEREDVRVPHIQPWSLFCSVHLQKATTEKELAGKKKIMNSPKAPFIKTLCVSLSPFALCLWRGDGAEPVGALPSAGVAPSLCSPAQVPPRTSCTLALSPVPSACSTGRCAPLCTSHGLGQLKKAPGGTPRTAQLHARALAGSCWGLGVTPCSALLSPPCSQQTEVDGPHLFMAKKKKLSGA